MSDIDRDIHILIECKNSRRRVPHGLSWPCTLCTQRCMLLYVLLDKPPLAVSLYTLHAPSGSALQPQVPIPPIPRPPEPSSHKVPWSPNFEPRSSRSYLSRSVEVRCAPQLKGSGAFENVWLLRGFCVLTVHGTAHAHHEVLRHVPRSKELGRAASCSDFLKAQPVSGDSLGCVLCTISPNSSSSIKMRSFRVIIPPSRDRWDTLWRALSRDRDLHSCPPPADGAGPDVGKAGRRWPSKPAKASVTCCISGLWQNAVAVAAYIPHILSKRESCRGTAASPCISACPPGSTSWLDD